LNSEKPTAFFRDFVFFVVCFLTDITSANFVLVGCVRN
jgi:hypothetical protein